MKAVMLTVRAILTPFQWAFSAFSDPTPYDWMLWVVLGAVLFIVVALAGLGYFATDCTVSPGCSWPAPGGF